MRIKIDGYMAVKWAWVWINQGVKVMDKRGLACSFMGVQRVKAMSAQQPQTNSIQHELVGHRVYIRTGDVLL